MPQLILGLGSNRQRTQHLTAALSALHQQWASAVTPLSCSRMFESAAVGFAGHDFYNCVVAVDCAAPLLDIIAFCKQLEIAHGHHPDAPRFSPRNLDIDVLCYGDWVGHDPMVLPREEITENAFVLWPLAELLPDAKHPQLQRSYAELWHAYPKQQQRLAPIEFPFPDLPFLRIQQP